MSRWCIVILIATILIAFTPHSSHPKEIKGCDMNMDLSSAEDVKKGDMELKEEDRNNLQAIKLYLCKLKQYYVVHGTRFGKRFSQSTEDDPPENNRNVPLYNWQAMYELLRNYGDMDN